MLNPIVERQLIEQLNRLDPSQQQRVLDFARELATATRPQGVPASKLKQFAGLIPKEDLAEMKRAIEEDCERIDLN
jgi:hypothetical protein